MTLALRLTAFSLRWRRSMVAASASQVLQAMMRAVTSFGLGLVEKLRRELWAVLRGASTALLQGLRLPA